MIDICIKQQHAHPTTNLNYQNLKKLVKKLEAYAYTTHLLDYLKKLFREIVKGRKDYENSVYDYRN